MAKKISDLLPFLLTPIAGFCMRHSLKVQDIIEAFKRAFLLAAQNELERAGAEASMSKLSVTTGLQRPEIVRLLKNSSKRTTKSLLSRIGGLWSGSARFQDAKGKARILTTEGRESEFASLVSEVSKELNPYAVLFELERSKMVRREGNGARLISDVYLASDNLAEGIRMLGSDIDALVNAVESNALRKEEIPNLHLKVHYDNICPEDLPKIRQFILTEGTAFIKSVQSYLSAFDKDLNPSMSGRPGGGSVVLGTFSTTSVQEDAPRRTSSKSLKAV